MRKIVVLLGILFLLCGGVWADDVPVFNGGTYAVNPGKEDGSIYKSYHQVEVYDEEYLAKKNVKDIAEAVKALPGINIKTDGRDGNISAIFYRGGLSGTEVAIYIDGIKMQDPYSHTPRINSVPVSSIKQIEVYKGGASAFYGAGAMSAVINIVTKKGDRGFVDIGYTKSLTKWSGLNYSFRKGISFGDYSVYGAIDKQNFYGDRESNDRFNSIKKEIGFGYAKDKLDINVKYIDQPETVYYPGATVGWSFPGKSVYKNSSYLGDLSYDKTSFKYSRNIYDMDAGSYGYKSMQDEYGIYQKMKINKQKVLLGFEKTVLHEQDEHYRNYENSYVLSSYHKFSNYRFFPAIRFVDNNDYGKEMFYSVGLNTGLAKDLLLKVNYSKNYKNPNVTQRKFSSSIEPEFVNEFVVGIDYSVANYGLSFDYFSKEYTDHIKNVGGVPTSSINPYGANYDNVKKAQVNGYEINADWQIMERLAFDISYTVNYKAINKDTNSDMEFVPKRTLSSNLSIGDKDANCYFTYILRGEFKEFSWNSFSTITHREVSTVDAGFNLYTYYVKATNIFDRRYENSEGYTAPGIRWYLGKKFEF